MNLAGALIVAALFVSADSSPWNVMPTGRQDADPTQMLNRFLRSRAADALARRQEEYSRLQTEGDCRAYQEKRRQFFVRQLGGFPERTPLNAEVVGSALQGDGYRVERVLFESRPNHHVSAVLYLPASSPPYPGVLIACGHSKTGKAADYNQRMGILLAKHGMAALCYDPIGQGERSQILKEDGTPKFGATTEHSLVGVGAILLGINTAQYRIYDGIRGLDYLASRPDIDAERLGCTGCSGGGTLTSYIMSLDSRVACAAPACYVTTFERLINTIGPQDAEQNIFGQIGFGMEQTDYVLMRAPKPTLICSTTRDFFDIQGSWHTFREAKRFYARLGVPQAVDLVEDDDRHGVTKLNRETLTHWMARWLLDVDEPVSEPDSPLWTVEQLQCTPQGEVLKLAGEKSVFDLNIELADRLADSRQAHGDAKTEDERRDAIRDVTKIRTGTDLPEPRVRKVGTLLRDGYRAEKWIVEMEPGLLLPALVFVPGKLTGNACLYLDGQSKAAAAEGPLQSLIDQGRIVMAVDLPGIGETGAEGQRSQSLFGDAKNAFLAYLLGDSLVKIRAEGTIVCARLLANYLAEESARPVELLATGQCGVPALHAAALEPKSFHSVELRDSIISWDAVARTPEARNQLVNVVHGALAVYDLPDLVPLAGSDKVTITAPVDAVGQPIAQ
jgi:hypothetical protein